MPLQPLQHALEPFEVLHEGLSGLLEALVGLAELHFLNLVARLDALDYLRQNCPVPPFPFPHPQTGKNKTQLYKSRTP